MRYMLDTNIVSHLLRQHPTVTARVHVVPMESLCISSITEGELLFGLAKRPLNKNLALAVQELLIRLESMAWDRAAAKSYGLVRAKMEKQGKGIGNLDLLIAAHAISLDATLVTNDKTFSQVPSLKVQDWLLNP